jgi:hypothetical protein
MLRSLRKRYRPPLPIRDIPLKELRIIRRYARDYDLPTWEQIARRHDLLAYALLLHEHAEVRYLREIKQVDLSDLQAVDRYYPEAHAQALRREHEFLQQVAEMMGYGKPMLAALIAMNSSVDPRTRREDLRIIQRYWPPREVLIRAEEMETAEQFFMTLREENHD